MFNVLTWRERRTKDEDAHGQGSNKSEGLLRPSGRTAEAPLAAIQPEETKGSGLWNWTSGIPQSADDMNIITAVGEVLVFAEMFVDNFYKDRYGQEFDLEVDWTKLQFPYLGPSTPQLFWYTRETTVLITHCLIYLLLPTISFEADSDLPSLLPPEFTAVMEAHKYSMAQGIETPNQAAAFSAHRVLTAYLRPDILEDESYIQQRDRSIQTFIQVFEIAFLPWASASHSSKDRRKYLKDLLVRTAALGHLMFSQASMFHFDWDIIRPDSDEMEVVIRPRLLKVFDENARFLEISPMMIRLKSEQITFVAEDEVNRSFPQREELQARTSQDGEEEGVLLDK